MADINSENQLRMELVSGSVDWDTILETIPALNDEEDEVKRRLRNNGW